jgi:hypothetical protein
MRDLFTMLKGSLTYLSLQEEMLICICESKKNNYKNNILAPHCKRRAGENPI